VRIATLANASVGHTARWVEYFRGRGHEVRVWSLEPGPPGLDAHILPVLPLPGALRYPLAVPALVLALDAFAPDLVDAHYVPNYGLMGALTGRHPLAVSPWGSDLLVAGARDHLQRARARYVLTRADLVVADAENLGAAARALGARPDRLRVVPWGIDLTQFRARPEPRAPGLLLSTRMHEPVYGMDTLIDAAAAVLAARPEARLVVVGDGSLRAQLEQQASRRLPAGRFTFTGRVTPDQMAAWLARSEVFVSASYSDSTSVSLLEAMASGAVPVVSDIAGNREWVSEGDGARLFPPGDAAALARAIESTLADPGWRESARARNRTVVETRADRARNMARVEGWFAALARGEAP
jgi:glycosyltransferase involved in cell wall biosynthesis